MEVCLDFVMCVRDVMVGAELIWFVLQVFWGCGVGEGVGRGWRGFGRGEQWWW